jgi:ectoine hydroxylase-related dioxygenase (phytanoyl-CoA dioxygenase family)
MPVQHLKCNATTDEICEVLERDGCVVIDAVLDRGDVDQVAGEMAPYIAASPKGEDDFDGLETRRAGTLIARSPKSREIIMNQRVLDVTARVLSHAKTFQLNLTEVVSLGPGSKAQEIHMDQADEEFRFPHGYNTILSTMWALTDFTDENGATRVVPGSHKLKDSRSFSYDESEPAEMKAGSVLLYTGLLYHGAGANSSDANRDGLIAHYILGWLRQEENQYLCVPPATLRELPEDLLRMMGYTRGAYLLGFVDGGRDPMIAARPEFERPMSEFRED